MGIALSVKALWTEAPAPDHVFRFEHTRIVIGRARGSDVQLPHPAVSATHATIHTQQDGYVIVDENSTNGTRVNDDKLVASRAKPLRDGDQINIGGFRLSVELGVPVVVNTSADHTSAIARKMVAELLGGDAPSASQTKLTRLNGPDKGTVFEIPPPPCTVVLGRATDCDLTLDDADASRHHAQLVVDLLGVKIVDMQSKNGLLVNGKTLKERTLIDRDLITIGGTELVYEDPRASALANVESVPDERIELLPIEEAPPTPPPEPASTPPDAPQGRPPSADLLIYGLAAVVLIASIAAFVWLMQGQ